MNITSKAFEEQQAIPPQFTCAGNGINPQLSFSDIPDGAKSLVLIVDDPDAPDGTFVHWVIYNINPAVKEIAENSSPEGKEGLNGAGRVGYIAPCPPSGTHHYHFKLYALDKMLEFSSETDKAHVEKEMEGHILDQAELVGLFSK